MIKSYLFIRERQWINHLNHIGSSGLLCISVINIHPTLILPHALQSSSLSWGHTEETYFYIPVLPQATSLPGEYFKFIRSTSSYVGLLSWFWVLPSLSRLSILGVLGEYRINIRSIFSYQPGSTVVLFHSTFRSLCMYLLPRPLTF